MLKPIMEIGQVVWRSPKEKPAGIKSILVCLGPMVYAGVVDNDGIVHRDEDRREALSCFEAWADMPDAPSRRFRLMCATSGPN